MQPLVFDDVTFKEEPVTIAGESYVLREATGKIGCTYRNAIMAGTKIGADGKPSGLTGIADTEPLLVSLCLFKVTKGEDPTIAPVLTPVSLETITSWPDRIHKALYERVKLISSLNVDLSDPNVKDELKKN